MGDRGFRTLDVLSPLQKHQVPIDLKFIGTCIVMLCINSWGIQMKAWIKYTTVTSYLPLSLSFNVQISKVFFFYLKESDLLSSWGL